MTRRTPWLRSSAVSVAALTVCYSLSLSAQGSNLVGLYGAKLFPALSRVEPIYPAAALKDRIEGVVVVDIRVAEDGSMKAATIIDAPRTDLGEAVRSALMKWKFKTLRLPEGTNAEIKSQFVFYCRIRNGRAAILDWLEMAKQTTGASRGGGEGPPTSYPTVSQEQWQGMKGAPLLIDVRDRRRFGEGHLRGATNIPERELTMRAPVEVPYNKPVVVDCPRSTGNLCSFVADILRRLEYKQVSLLVRD
jgi:TonB family protein